jgi:alkanesulfonate monooxygenase SsuD/methylene tetrahydromethanopterin reductase-like flavin-dependent oxidoreductase (luciferase family)
MLRLIGRRADGWLPSLPYLKSPADLAPLNEQIDEAAVAAGRAPTDIRRLLNIGPMPAEQLTEIALTHGISGFIRMGDEPRAIEVFGNEIAPAVREAVARVR